MKSVAKWVALPLIALLIITGCTAVGGLDIQKAIQANLKTTSSESKQTIKFELEPTSDTLSKEDKDMIALINSTELHIDSAKVQSAKEMSIKGDISYLGKKLPFQLSMDEKGMAIQLEGAKKPFYMSLQNSNTENIDFKKYEEQVQVLSAKFYEVILKHAPNPKNISVKSVQENINGQSTNLTQLHVELNGEEVVSLIKPFLTSLVKDEAGLKELIGVFYDFLVSMEDVGSGVAIPNLGNKETTVAMAYGMIQPALTKFLANYDEQLATVYKEIPQLNTVLGKDTVLKTDVYFDNSLKIRKQHVELKVMLPTSDYVPVKSFKVTSDIEVWNIGSDVKAEKVDLSGGAVEYSYDSETNMTPGTVLRNFEPNSDVYSLLKNQLEITKQTFMIDSESDYYNIIKKQGTTFIPLRQVTNPLDAEVKWTKGSNVITIIDDITQKEIVLTVGSKEAVVAGETVQLAAPVFVHKDGSTYVPLRFLAEALGGSLHIDSDGWFTITRD
jgi:hypothetical protein